LASNISCAAGQGSIQLLSGLDLDLAGYDITCTESSSTKCAYPAISMASSASKVTSSSATDEAVISGPFSVGVYCGGYGTSIVEKITINGGVTGILDCQTVRNNVVGASTDYNQFSTNFGILTGGVSNSDSITDNHVSTRVWPIYSTSPYSLDVQRNVIKGTGEGAIVVGANQSSSSGKAEKRKCEV
jgi:hypothetical protein